MLKVQGLLSDHIYVGYTSKVNFEKMTVSFIRTIRITKCLQYTIAIVNIIKWYLGSNGNIVLRLKRGKEYIKGRYSTYGKKRKMKYRKHSN